MATPREQFIQALKEEIKRIELAARRIESLMPIGPQIQRQWESIAESRRLEAEGLRTLLRMAEEEWGITGSGESATKPLK